MKGFVEVVIPEVIYNSCHECDYYKLFMLQSGFNPIYAHNCNHPDYRKSSSIMSGNLGSDATPDDCPYHGKKINK